MRSFLANQDTPTSKPAKPQHLQSMWPTVGRQHPRLPAGHPRPGPCASRGLTTTGAVDWDGPLVRADQRPLPVRSALFQRLFLLCGAAIGCQVVSNRLRMPDISYLRLCL